MDNAFNKAAIPPETNHTLGSLDHCRPTGCKSIGFPELLRFNNSPERLTESPRHWTFGCSFTMKATQRAWFVRTLEHTVSLESGHIAHPAHQCVQQPRRSCAEFRCLDFSLRFLIKPQLMKSTSISSLFPGDAGCCSLSSSLWKHSWLRQLERGRICLASG